MLRPSRAATGTARIAGLLLAASLAGCRSSGPLEDAGIALAVPSGWRAAEPSAFVVPGTPLAAWRGPGGSTLVVSRPLPAPGASAGSIGTDLANRLTNLPGLCVLARTVEPIGGREAAR